MARSTRWGRRLLALATVSLACVPFFMLRLSTVPTVLRHDAYVPQLRSPPERRVVTAAAAPPLRLVASNVLDEVKANVNSAAQKLAPTFVPPASEVPASLPALPPPAAVASPGTTSSTQRGKLVSALAVGDSISSKVTDKGHAVQYMKRVFSVIAQGVAQLGALPAPGGETDTIFVSIVAYRDTPTCLRLLNNIFAQAELPQTLSVGVVETRCVAPPCVRGVHWGESREAVSSPTLDAPCVDGFCASVAGRAACDAGRVRSVQMNEKAALSGSPAFARFAAAQLYEGEAYFVQLGAGTGSQSNALMHGWDVEVRRQLAQVGARGVLSHHPPASLASAPSPRTIGALCSAAFAPRGAPLFGALLPQQLRRTVGGASAQPRRAAFATTAFIAARAALLREVPFDPYILFLPTVSEDVLLSARLWTHGWRVFSPAKPIVARNYAALRDEEAPRWQEDINRRHDSNDAHNALAELSTLRMKRILLLQAAAGDDAYVVSEAPRFGLGARAPLDALWSGTGVDAVHHRPELTSTASRVREDAAEIVRATRLTWCARGVEPGSG